MSAWAFCSQYRAVSSSYVDLALNGLMIGNEEVWAGEWQCSSGSVASSMSSLARCPALLLMCRVPVIDYFAEKQQMLRCNIRVMQCYMYGIALAKCQELLLLL